MTDAFAQAGFVRPDYGGRCLDAVLPAAAAALCAGLGQDPAALPAGADDARTRLGLPAASRVVVVLVDGLGQELLTERAGHAPFLRSRSAETTTLTVGYPSTTAASMGMFGTGRSPGRTGLVGYTVRNPEHGGLANLVSWDGAGDATRWQREPTVFAALAATGAPVTSVGPAAFAGSGLTEAALRGATYVRAESLADRVDAALYELSAPGLVYLYWGDVDKAGHQHGWRSGAWGDALAEADRELGRLARGLPRGTLLLVTADHGMVDVDHAQLVDVAATPALARDVVLVAGEPRASHVHVRPGTAEAVAERWRATLGDAALVALRDEAVAAGWFGPVAEHVLPMLGDVVVAARGVAGVTDSRTQTPHSLTLRGMHGSFTPGEMLVPLVVSG
ncbi:alkaline phosphatase family protein [Actinotalea ferrariae]|nr:alkaline phosphatase family protein [Actinotalea ferrariae]